MQVRIEPVQPDQVGLLLELIRQLAEYERRLDQVQATEADLRAALFREGSPVRAVLAWRGQEAVGYALYYPGSLRSIWRIFSWCLRTGGRELGWR